MCLFVASCSERGGVWTPFLRTQWLLQASSLWPPDYKTLTLVNQDRTHLGHTARFHNMKADCSAKQTSCSAALTVWSWIFASEFSSWHWLLPRQRSHRSTSSWFLVPSPRRDKSGLWKRWTECRCTNLRESSLILLIVFRHSVILSMRLQSSFIPVQTKWFIYFSVLWLNYEWIHYLCKISSNKVHTEQFKYLETKSWVWIYFA